MDLEIVEVETNIAVVTEQGKAEKRNGALAAARRAHTDNWIAERVAAAVESALANGSLPA